MRGVSYGFLALVATAVVNKIHTERDVSVFEVGVAEWLVRIHKFVGHSATEFACIYCCTVTFKCTQGAVDRNSRQSSRFQCFVCFD
jgi:hypothetical protein